MTLSVLKLVIIFIIIFILIFFIFNKISLLSYIIFIEILFLSILVLFCFISCEKYDVIGQTFCLYLLGVFAAETAIMLTLFIAIYTTQVVENYDDEKNLKDLKQKVLSSYFQEHKNFSMKLITKKSLKKSIFIKETLIEKIVNPKQKKNKFNEKK
jgi:NADH:ubiquinone oxidoreductase subunit K